MIWTPTGSIQYIGGPWFEDTSATDSPGNWGHALFGTLHGTNSSAAITFIFNGILDFFKMIIVKR